MKPVKGINTDVSPQNQPDGTYRRAYNFIYGKQLDALIQESGAEFYGLFSQFNNHILGVHVLDDGEWVVFAISNLVSPIPGIDFNLGSIWIYRPNAPIGSQFTQVLAQTENNYFALDFSRFDDFDVVSFKYFNGDRYVVFTNGYAPPKIVNIDRVYGEFFDGKDLYLFPQINSVQITGNSVTGGELAEGAYFVGTRYITDDGGVTKVTDLAGPFYVRGNNNGLNIRLENVGRSHKFLDVVLLSVINNQISVRVVQRFSTASTISTAPYTISTRILTGAITLEELTLEDITVMPQSYTRVGSMEMHDNRLYIANLETKEDVSLQEIANAIWPEYHIIDNNTPEDHATEETYLTEDESLDEVGYPENTGFMPDEVYALYVSFIRDDGSYSPAYHIPGRPILTNVLNAGVIGEEIDLVTYRAPYNIDYHPDALAKNYYEINLNNSLQTILDSNIVPTQPNYLGLMNFLNIDKNIFGEGGKYWMGRCTAICSAEGPTKGLLGIWQNQDELYPANFPDQTVHPLSWILNLGEYSLYDTLSIGTVPTEQVEIANKPVSHHRMPSISWLKEMGYDWNDRKNPRLKLVFHNVDIPAGYQGVRFYYAKRTGSNCIVQGTSPVIHGSPNWFAEFGNGGGNREHYSQTTYNLWVRNSYVSSNNENFIPASTDFKNKWNFSGDPNYGTNSYSSYIRLECGISPEFGMIKDKPGIEGPMYFKGEQVFHYIQSESADVEGYYDAVNGDFDQNHIIGLRTDQEPIFYARNPEDDAPTDPESIYGKQRKAIFQPRVLNGGFISQQIPYTCEILGIAKNKYVASNNVDDEIGFDNRYGMESMVSLWNGNLQINDFGEYTNGQELLQSLEYTYKNIPNIIGNVGENTWNFAEQGILLDVTTIASNQVPRQPIMVGNYNRVARNCYEGYTLQDLVACTPACGSMQFNQANPINFSYPRRGVYTDFNNSIWHRPRYTVGDVIRSMYRFRLTAPMGANARFNDQSANNGTWGYIATDGVIAGGAGTVDAETGTISTVYYNSVYTPYNHLFRDTYQTNLNDWEFVYRPASPEENNEYTFKSDFLQLNQWQQPLIYNADDPQLNKFPYRIHRSLAFQPDSTRMTIREFAPLDYLEQPKDRGPITNLQDYGDKLLIHHEKSLYITSGKEKIVTTSGVAALGDGDIFDVRPQEILTTEFGYAGTQNKAACVLTPAGYFFVDLARKKVFLYNGQLKEISSNGMRDFFNRELDIFKGFWRYIFSTSANYDYPTELGGSNLTATHSFMNGVAAAYDEKTNRVVLFIRNTTSKDVTPARFPNTQEELYTYGYILNSGLSPYNVVISDPQTWKWAPKDTYISFSFDNNAWVSFHNYNADILIGGLDGLYGIQNAGPQKVYRYNSPKVLPEADVKASIDIAFGAPKAAHWRSFEWIAKAYWNPRVIGGITVFDDTFSPANGALHNQYKYNFDYALVFTDTHNSGYVALYEPDPQLGVPIGTVRLQEGRWKFNAFRDIISDRDEPTMSLDGQLITSNLNPNKPYYEKRNIISDNIVLRLETGKVRDADVKALLYLYEVTANARLSAR